jgi:HAD superfamily hydrolase (TIGR01450 family)
LLGDRISPLMTANDPTAHSRKALQDVRHVVLDLDGTLYRGNRLFDVTLPFLAMLRERGIGYTFLTNNTSRSKTDYVDKLRGLGIETSAAQIYTPADSTITYLRDTLPAVKTLGVLGTPSLCRQFEEAGFTVRWGDCEAVVVGFDTTLDYDRLCRAAYGISLGLPFIATHPDLVCPTDEPTVLVDCGAICACLTAATNRTPIVLGKPDPGILLNLAARHKLQPSQLAMVGDRIYTDIAMAQRAGSVSVLVLSGEATFEDASAMPTPPDYVLADVGELGRRLAAAD